MIRTILVGIDGSDYAKAAVEYGISLCQRGESMLVGLGVIDQPHVCGPEPVPLGAGSFKGMIDETRLRDARLRIQAALEHFSIRCADAGVSSKPLEDIGLPSDRIALEAQRYDLIMMGQETFFNMEYDAGETLRPLLRNAPRPVVVVPKEWSAGKSVLIAYDGSLQSARALYAFVASGLAGDFDLHVFSIADKPVDAARCANRAVEFLEFHDLKAKAHTGSQTGAVAGAILDQAKQLNAAMLVMGCYGETTVREFFLGSVTRTLLEDSQVPLFLYH